MIETLYEWDCQTLLWIQEHIRCDFLTPVMKFFTYLGNGGMFAIALALILLILPKTRRDGLVCACSLLVNALIVNVALKNIIDRIRPYERIQDLKLLIGVQSDSSFPSGHSAACFSVAVVLLIRVDKKLSIPVLLVSTVIAFSRLYVGVHYPSDVLAGIGVGTLVACLSCLLARKYLDKSKK